MLDNRRIETSESFHPYGEGVSGVPENCLPFPRDL